jgi:hypothetical protein
MKNYYTFTDLYNNKQIILVSDSFTLSIPADAANTDYQQHLAWLEEGNAPEEWNPEGAE